jgi:hypothetical protein
MVVEEPAAVEVSLPGRAVEADRPVIGDVSGEAAVAESSGCVDRAVVGQG